MTATNGAHGTVIYNNDGTFTYTPTGVYVGSDSFTYTIKDGDGDTSTATVTVSVQTNTTPTGGGSVALLVNEAALDLTQDASPAPADLHAGKYLLPAGMCASLSPGTDRGTLPCPIAASRITAIPLS